MYTAGNNVYGREEGNQTQLTREDAQGQEERKIGKAA